MNVKPTEYVTNFAWKSNIISFLNFVYRPLSRTEHRHCISFRPQVKRWKAPYLFVSFFKSWSSSFYNIR